MTCLDCQAPALDGDMCCAEHRAATDAAAAAEAERDARIMDGTVYRETLAALQAAWRLRSEDG